MTAVVGCVRAGMGFAVIPYVTLQDAITAQLNWFPFGAPPIHRRLGVVFRPSSGREEVLTALTEALVIHGKPVDDVD
jgi:DNA-binding transcriptional LysR family regulator